MKIVMLCDFYNENLEYQENILTKYYTKYGHDVTVICSTYESVFEYYWGSHDKSRPEKTYYDGKAKIIRLKYQFNILNRLRRYTSITPILELEKPDLIYVHDVMLNMLEGVRYMKKHPEVRMIMDYHADYSNSAKNWLSLKVLHGICRKWYLDRARPHISRIFPIVPGSAKFLHEVYKVPMEEMEVLPLGADIDQGQIARASDNLDNLRAKYGIGPGTQVIFSGGKLEPRKQTQHLIEAFNQMNLPDAKLLIVGEAPKGDNEYKQSLLDLAGNNPNIHFVGWLDKTGIYEHMAIATIAAFPASQSIIWQQAISMGLPLLVGNTGEQSIAYLNLYDNIIMLENQDINTAQFKLQLERIINDRELYQKMHQGALKVSSECLDWNNLINRTLQFNAR